ncbi:MAG: DUF3887 domain-containing protein [Candidatus Dormiibacterota bacterium]
MAAGSSARETLATLLEQNAAVVARALRQPPGGSALGALSASITMTQVAEDAMRSLVADARVEGRTWAEIGTILRTSRQAAQQRFKAEMEMGDQELEGLGAEGLKVLGQWAAGEGSLIVPRFDEAVRQRLDEAGLVAAWAQVEELSGRLLTVGRPTVAARGRYRVVDIPLAFERGPMKARITFDPEERISGLFVLYPDLP